MVRVALPPPDARRRISPTHRTLVAGTDLFRIYDPASPHGPRDGKSFQIPGAISTGKRLGMQLMDQSLLSLVRAGEIDPDEAFLKAEDKWGFAPFLTRPELLGIVNGELRAA